MCVQSAGFVDSWRECVIHTLDYLLMSANIDFDFDNDNIPNYVLAGENGRIIAEALGLDGVDPSLPRLWTHNCYPGIAAGYFILALHANKFGWCGGPDENPSPIDDVVKVFNKISIWNGAKIKNRMRYGFRQGWRTVQVTKSLLTKGQFMLQLAIGLYRATEHDKIHEEPMIMERDHLVQTQWNMYGLLAHMMNYTSVLRGPPLGLFDEDAVIPLERVECPSPEFPLEVEPELGNYTEEEMDEAEGHINTRLEEENMRVNLEMIGELNMELVLRPRMDILTCDGLVAPLLRGEDGEPVHWKDLRELFSDLFEEAGLHGSPDMVLMMPVMHIITVIGKHDLWPAGFRLHCPLGYLTIQLLMMVFFGNSQGRHDELRHPRSIKVNGRDQTWSEIMRVSRELNELPEWFDDTISLLDILDSGWPINGVHVLYASQIMIDLHLTHKLKIHPDEETLEGMGEFLYQRDAVQSDIKDIYEPCPNMDSNIEGFRESVLNELRSASEGCTFCLLDFLYSELYVPGLEIPRESLDSSGTDHLRSWMPDSGVLLTLLPEGVPRSGCPVAAGIALIGLAHLLRCDVMMEQHTSSGTSSRMMQFREKLVKSADRLLSEYEAGLPSHLHMFANKWPTPDFLWRLQQDWFSWQPESNSTELNKIIAALHQESEHPFTVSYDSDESHVGGGNWARFFAHGAFDGVAKVAPDLPYCAADVWIFRAAAPLNFGGVGIFVDGEAGLDLQEISQLRYYPKFLYIGPEFYADEVERGNMRTASFQPKGMPLPYISTHFAERSDFEGNFELLRETLTKPRELKLEDKPNFCAYMSYNCHSHREKFYRTLNRLHDGVDALSVCRGLQHIDQDERYEQFQEDGGKGHRYVRARAGSASDVMLQLGEEEQEEDKVNVTRFTQFWLDDTLYRYSKYRWAVAFENQVEEGYHTEKLMSVLLAGAVGIYWGHESIKGIINPDAFLHAQDFESLEALAERVIEIENDPEQYRRMATAPITTEKQFDRWFAWGERDTTANNLIMHKVGELMQIGVSTLFGMNWSDLWFSVRR